MRAKRRLPAEDAAMSVLSRKRPEPSERRGPPIGVGPPTSYPSAPASVAYCYIFNSLPSIRNLRIRLVSSQIQQPAAPLGWPGACFMDARLQSSPVYTNKQHKFLPVCTSMRQPGAQLWCHRVGRQGSPVYTCQGAWQRIDPGTHSQQRRDRTVPHFFEPTGV